MLPLAWALNIEFVPVRMRSTIVTIIMMGYSFGTFIAAPMTNWIAPLSRQPEGVLVDVQCGAVHRT